MLLDPLGVQPADLVKCLPQLACFVDVNLASLLSISLPELFANCKSFDSLDEDSSLRGEVSGAIEAKIGGKGNFVRVEEVGMRVVLQINWSTFPIDLERVWLVW